MKDGMSVLLQHLEVPGGYAMLDSEGGDGGEGSIQRGFDLACGEMLEVGVWATTRKLPFRVDLGYVRELALPTGRTDLP